MELSGVGQAGRADEIDVAAVARLLAEPARATMLTVLLDGRAHPASALADAAGISRPTASAHLQRLVAAGLVRVSAAGRHRYHSLAGPEVAHALEALAALAQPSPVVGLTRVAAARRLATARSCYDHLAGRAGVVLRDALLQHGVLVPAVPPDHDFRSGMDSLTEDGADRLRELGLDPEALTAGRRRLVRDCHDWTERIPHLAGALPAALLVAVHERGWLVRGTGRRIDVPEAGWEALRRWLRCEQSCHTLPTSSAHGPARRE